MQKYLKQVSTSRTIYNKLGQSCAKLCSSFESFASNIYTLTGGWLGRWLGGWFNFDYIAIATLSQLELEFCFSILF